MHYTTLPLGNVGKYNYYYTSLTPSPLYSTLGMIWTQIRLPVEDLLSVPHWDVGVWNWQSLGICLRCACGFSGHGLDGWSGPLSSWVGLGLQMVWQCQTIVMMPVTYRFYPEERSCGKDIGFNLMSCAPDVLPVLSICGMLEQQNSIGKTWSNDRSQSRRSGSRELEDQEAEVWDGGMSEEDLDKRRTRVSSLY
jgi:hypothetical protein